MFHTGDEFEIRARAARNCEIRALGRALTGFFFRTQSSNKRSKAAQLDTIECANDVTATTKRAA
ncbi:MAG: hypothetical protein ABJN98_02580 [Roseibium sp.]